MKIFHELTIRGPGDKLRTLPTSIERRLDDGWSRNQAREDQAREAAHGRRGEWFEMLCFHCEAKVGREAADLWLWFQEPTELRVTNILPTETEELSPTQYNHILQDFTDRFVKPAAEPDSLQVLITKPDLSLNELAPPDVVQALVQFSRLANKSTGKAHPRDKERWDSFVIAAHQAHADLDYDTLRRWLEEEEHWPSEVAHELAIEYEQARALLEEYDRQLQNA